MAEYIFPDSKNIPSEVLEDLINRLKNKKTITKYTTSVRYKKTYKEEVKRTPMPSETFFGRLFESFFGVVSYREEVRNVEVNVPEYYQANYIHTAIGGIDAIELVMAIGLSLKNAYTDKSKPKYKIDEFRKIVKENFTYLDERDDIISMLRRAASRGIANRADISNQLYPLVRVNL